MEKWAKSIPRADRKLRPGIDNVCEKHFDESEIKDIFFINFFLVTRMHFICSRTNVIDNAKKEKSKLHRKSAKLI